jgi:hypothetical protein
MMSTNQFQRTKDLDAIKRLAIASKEATLSAPPSPLSSDTLHLRCGESSYVDHSLYTSVVCMFDK